MSDGRIVLGDEDFEDEPPRRGSTDAFGRPLGAPRNADAADGGPAPWAAPAGGSQRSVPFGDPPPLDGSAFPPPRGAPMGPPPGAWAPAGHPGYGPPPGTAPIGAVIALVLGILGVIFCPLVLSIPAIIVGHVSMRQAAALPGRPGYGMALSGAILGWIGTTLTAFVVLYVFGIAASF